MADERLVNALLDVIDELRKKLEAANYLLEEESKTSSYRYDMITEYRNATGRLERVLGEVVDVTGDIGRIVGIVDQMLRIGSSVARKGKE